MNTENQHPVAADVRRLTPHATPVAADVRRLTSKILRFRIPRPLRPRRCPSTLRRFIRLPRVQVPVQARTDDMINTRLQRGVPASANDVNRFNSLPIPYSK